MLTITCHFEFTDGHAATASVELQSPEDRAEITYTGSFHRLPNPFLKTFGSTLRLWAEQAAAANGAKLSITESGQYDTWAV